LSPEAKEFLIEKGFDPVYGARAMMISCASGSSKYRWMVRFNGRAP
jgi:hypothetical protein